MILLKGSVLEKAIFGHLVDSPGQVPAISFPSFVYSRQIKQMGAILGAKEHSTVGNPRLMGPQPCLLLRLKTNTKNPRNGREGPQKPFHFPHIHTLGPSESLMETVFSLPSLSLFLIGEPLLNSSRTCFLFAPTQPTAPSFAQCTLESSCRYLLHICLLCWLVSSLGTMDCHNFTTSFSVPSINEACYSNVCWINIE